MGEVRVFVDDAVTGMLPPVCTKDGLPTGDRLKVSAPVGDSAGLGVAWLLILAGPPGWLALFLLGGGATRTEVVTVEVPMSEPAYQRLLRARRHRRLAAAGTWAAVGLGILLAYLGTWTEERWMPFGVLLALVALGSAVAWIIAVQRSDDATVGVHLDGSRRWVTLTGLHSHFVTACNEVGSARLGDTPVR